MNGLKVKILKLVSCNRWAGCGMDSSGSEWRSVGECSERHHEPPVSKTEYNYLGGSASATF
jgi:hypothetical protein